MGIIMNNQDLVERSLLANKYNGMPQGLWTVLIYFGPGDTAGLQYVGPEIDAMAAVASAHEAEMFVLSTKVEWFCWQS